MLFRSPDPVTDYVSAARSDTGKYAKFHHAMLKEGVYLPPSQFEACFLSARHTQKDIDRTIIAARKAKL